MMASRVVSWFDDESAKMVVSGGLRYANGEPWPDGSPYAPELGAECYRASPRTAAASASTRFASRDLVASWSSCVASDVRARRDIVRSALVSIVRAAAMRSAGRPFERSCCLRDAGATVKL